jgi:hypothetical protein
MKFGLAAALAMALTLSVAFLHFNRSVAVTVKNVGPNPLHAVIVQATGFSHTVGDIDPGQSREIAVSARGESHIELEHSDGPRLVVNCYFENGYRGRISADVSGNVLVRKECNVRTGVF